MKIRRFLESNSDYNISMLNDLLEEISDMDGISVVVHRSESFDATSIYDKLCSRKSHNFLRSDWARFYSLIREILEGNVYEIIISGAISFPQEIEDFINRAYKYGNFSEVGVIKGYISYTIKLVKGKDEMVKKIRDIIVKGI